MLITEQELSAYKAKQPVALQCVACSGIFHRAKNVVLMAHNGQRSGKRGGRTLNACGRACAAVLQRRQPNAICGTCAAPLRKPASELTISGNNFCSKSCAGTHYNRNKVTGTTRSKAEHMLVEILLANFPALVIDTNSRQFLPSGCEIDILVKGNRLAIELNGPTHYKPIFGQAKFERIQRYDRQKKAELHDLGYTLLVLDITNASREHQLPGFLQTAYEEQIKHLLTD